MPDPMRWLAEGVPLTLLIDLLEPAGPRSRDIHDGEPAEVAWLMPVGHAA
jgi:hypothetical protein